MKKIGLGILIVCSVGLLTSCKTSEVEMINTERVDSKNIEQINLSYKSEDLRFFIGSEDEIVIEEYLGSEKDKATVRTQNGRLSIESGKNDKWRILPTLTNHVDIYLPKEYQKDLIIETNSGSVELADSFELNKVSIEQNSGDLKIKEIKADEMSFRTSSGSLKGDLLDSDNIKAASNSGSVKFGKILGNADLETKSGSIKTSFVSVSKNVQAVSKSGNVSIELPKNLSFDFQGETKSGSFLTDYEMSLSGPEEVVTASIGNGDKKIVKIKTNSGNIELTKR
ncbi:DUF4097 family beta strand repeat-containing protein [Vagococcus fluvialis]|uniref:DUF4097 family beta strand repeat-containing protein n=1 Tax=Vagococcus fluvialis TaxID=2738 RepID=UPI003B5980D4